MKLTRKTLALVDQANEAHRVWRELEETARRGPVTDVPAHARAYSARVQWDEARDAALEAIAVDSGSGLMLRPRVGAQSGRTGAEGT